MISLLRKVESIGSQVATIANAIGTLIVLALVMVVNYDVVARGFFNNPFHGAVELVQFSMVLIVCKYLNKLINLIAFVFMVLIAVAIWPEFVDMFETRDYFGVPGVFTAPWWPIKLVIFISAVLCSLLFSLKVLLPDADEDDSNSSTR